MALVQVIAGLDWVKANHRSPAAVVMALGGDGQTTLDLAVHNLALSGLAVFVAAGNEDTDACTKSPARCCSTSLMGWQLKLLMRALPLQTWRMGLQAERRTCKLACGARFAGCASDSTMLRSRQPPPHAQPSAASTDTCKMLIR